MSRIVLDSTTMTAKIIREVIEKEIPLADYFLAMGNSAPVCFPLLPLGCRSLLSSQTNSVAIVEQQPRTHILNYHHDGKKHAFKIHLPWLYWAITFQNNPIVTQRVTLCWAKHRVLKPDAVVGNMPFSNFLMHSFGQQVCFGETKMNDNLPFNQFMDELICVVMDSPYNDHYLNNDHQRNWTSVIPEIIRTAFAKNTVDYYRERGTVAEGEKETKEQKHAKYIAERFDGVAGLRLYEAWQEVSNEMSLDEFMLAFDFHESKKYKYNDFLNDAMKELAANGRF